MAHPQTDPHDTLALLDRLGRAGLANTAWESLFRAQVVLMRSLTAEPDWQKLSLREYDVLYALSKAADGLTMTALLDHGMLTQPGMSRLVARLAERGLVTRDPAAADARSVVVRLTADGRAAQKQVGRAHAHHVVERMSVLTPAQLRTLTELCTQLTNLQSDRITTEPGNGTARKAAS